MSRTPAVFFLAICLGANAQDSSKTKGELTQNDLRKIIASTADFKQATVVKQVAPRYSNAARDAKIEGKVWVSVKLNEKGEATDFQVTKSLGMGLDEEAVAALRQWKFTPATKAGKPVPTSLVIELAFNIGKNAPPPDHVMPKLISSTAPSYTAEAREARIEGIVRITLVVNIKGQPEDLRVEKGLGMGLDEEAMRAVRQWRYEPGIKDGKPFPHLIAVDVRFALTSR